MAALRALFCVLALFIVAVTAADPPPQFSQKVTASTTNGTFNSYPLPSFTTPDGLAGPVNVALDGLIGTAISVCISSVPVFSNNLKNACPSQGFVPISNNTLAQLEAKFARKSFSAFSSTKRLSGRFGRSVEDTPTTTVTLLPNTAYYVSVTSGTVSEEVILELSGVGCAAGLVGPTCAPTTAATVGAAAPVSVPAQEIQYFAVDATSYNSSTASITFSLSPTPANDVAGLTLLAQVGTAPTQASSIASGTTVTIANPSTLGGALYIGVLNSNMATTTGQLTSTSSLCPAGQFGGNNGACVALSSIQLISAALGTQVYSGKKGSGWAYYQVDSTTIPANAQVVRVSVSSSNSQTVDTIYAKFGSPPSASSFSNVASGQYVNQVVLVNNQPPANAEAFNATAWYVAVDTTNSDFTLWAGNNCAGTCNSWNQTASNNGYCVCAGTTCDGTTSYLVPTTSDSFGVCQCKDTKKQNNFDCTALVEGSSPFKTVYIVLIAVGGAIVLAVAIGVPVYCYLQNRKRDYERL